MHDSMIPPAPSNDRGQLGTGLLFLALASGGFVIALLMNRQVLTPEAYRALLATSEASASQIDLMVEGARRFEFWGYLINPFVLLVRAGSTALLVQLALLGLGSRMPLAHLFRCALLAQVATWLGSAIQVAWLSSLPAGALTLETVQELPGSLAAFFPTIGAQESPLALLSQQVTLFDFGWLLIFAMALHTPPTLPFPRALLAVAAVWSTLTLSRWGLYLYLSGLS